MGHEEAFPKRLSRGGEHMHRVHHLLLPGRHALSRRHHHQIGAHSLPILVEGKRSNGAVIHLLPTPTGRWARHVVVNDAQAGTH